MNIGSQIILEENQPLFGVPATNIIPGTQLIAKGVYIFECPLCKKHWRGEDRFEPICTGPSENRDDHAPEVMRLVRTEARKIFSLPGGAQTFWTDEKGKRCSTAPTPTGS